MADYARPGCLVGSPDAMVDQIGAYVTPAPTRSTSPSGPRGTSASSTTWPRPATGSPPDEQTGTIGGSIR